MHSRFVLVSGRIVWLQLVSVLDQVLVLRVSLKYCMLLNHIHVLCFRYLKKQGWTFHCFSFIKSGRKSNDYRKINTSYMLVQSKGK